MAASFDTPHGPPNTQMTGQPDLALEHAFQHYRTDDAGRDGSASRSLRDDGAEQFSNISGNTSEPDPGNDGSSLMLVMQVKGRTQILWSSTDQAELRGDGLAKVFDVVSAQGSPEARQSLMGVQETSGFEDFIGSLSADPEFNDALPDLNTTFPKSNPRPVLNSSQATAQALSISPPAALSSRFALTPKYLRIGDTEEVITYLKDRLKLVQQAALKVTARAWIKGICPKKQSRFPYRDNVAKPAWWPALETCPFTEPDHLKREERVALCVHLLRLRPTSQQLMEWNKDIDIRAFSMPEPFAWTEFLMKFAPVDVFKDLLGESVQQTQRQRCLQDIYHVAQLEEDYINSGRDGDPIFTYSCDEPIRRKSSEKNVLRFHDTLGDVRFQAQGQKRKGQHEEEGRHAFIASSERHISTLSDKLPANAKRVKLDLSVNGKSQTRPSLPNYDMVLDPALAGTGQSSSGNLQPDVSTNDWELLDGLSPIVQLD